MTQRVLVTAGASGIGVAIAQAFVADGAKVHIGDIDADAVAEAVRGRDNMSDSVTDVSDADAVDRLFGDLDDHVGGLDVVVNNAGIGGATAPFEDWRAVVESTSTGPSTSPSAPSRCSRRPEPPRSSPCKAP